MSDIMLVSHNDMMMRGYLNVAMALLATDYKDPPISVRERERERDGQMDGTQKYVVRRLTPAQCGRLQGFPDGWTDDVKGSDASRYKLWGNGMCLPVILYCQAGMVDILKQRKLQEWVDSWLGGDDSEDNS